MSKPIKRRELIRRLQSLGWNGPEPGAKHEIMFKGRAKLTIPNPHQKDIDWSLTKRVLRQAGVSHQAWDSTE
jgi:predicted RNA binding protein YcfA (HicA-like mRNA interferase family)